MSEKLIENYDQIKLNENQEIQQILGRPPGCLLHFGIMVVALAVAFLVAVSWFVKYPDVIPAKVQLLTENPPIRLFARTDGKISELLVKNKQTVDKDQLLAILENTANWEDVMELDKTLESLPKSYDQLNQIELPKNLNLGILQSSFSEISQLITAHNIFVNQSIARKKTNAIDEKIKQINALNQSMENQKSTLQKMLEISAVNLGRKENLLKQGDAATVDMEKAETTYLEFKRQVEDISTTIITNNIEKENLDIQKLEIQKFQKEKNSLQLLSIMEKLQNFKSEIKNWQQTFLIKAPIAGQVAMDKIWSPMQYVKSNEKIMTIVPPNSSDLIIGKALLPQNASGKVKKGLRVNIRLDAFPYQEFGALKASVKSLSLIPTDGVYLLELDIPKSLTTTYNKTIMFQQEMQGTANIITEDRRIIERIFDKVLSSIKNR